VIEKKYIDIEDRLINFTVRTVLNVEALPNSKGANYLGSKLLRSGTLPVLNYGQAKATESKKDLIHKMRICLK